VYNLSLLDEILESDNLNMIYILIIFMDWKKVIRRLWFIPIVAYPLISLIILFLPKKVGILLIVVPSSVFILYLIAEQIMREEQITIKNVWKWLIPLALFFLFFQGTNKAIELNEGCRGAGGSLGCGLAIFLLILGLIFIAAVVYGIHRASKRSKKSKS